MARDTATVDGSIRGSHAAPTGVSAAVTATADAPRAVDVDVMAVIAMDATAIATIGIMTGGRRGIGMSVHALLSQG